MQTAAKSDSSRRPPYAYIRRAYGVTPIPGFRVKHEETGRVGTIRRTPRSNAHHVSVLFDGDKFSLPCHPTALNYLQVRS